MNDEFLTTAYKVRMDKICSCAPRVFCRASQGPAARPVVPFQGVQGKA